ncbi:hypothetical protein [Mycolicibacterium iranicum]|uniref:Uncharacterized protein n=1 Tax=Mycolicibacterium iranicum TaxID=912594 RepID=A0A1X1WEF3_MYCIR|nr:hypothetical protein [Mycolicibacterium iranicum]MCZ0729316.1 hypothetical protein [Mycolicibacterium iranicum]ORV84959.1 hypothetical protein AWC12_00345 [Mycolicibacterium iranicum]
MTTQCRACRLGLEHCHGALIHHSFSSAIAAECTEDDCFVAYNEHELHIDCRAVGCRCDEAVAGSAHRVG